MIRAKLINAFRRRFPHPAAIACREESRRAREAAARTREKEMEKALQVATLLRIEAARKVHDIDEGSN